ncbi:MAG TPA: NYN domain-containing protein [Aggregatilineaceae bacterium]|nr:NYN domain-containing protein [Aggregatilineaceae bacterium]
MHYLIDGHNLIARVPGMRLDDPNDEAKLVERLRAFMARKRQSCTVVFDKGLPGGPSRDLSTYSVKVVFAHGGTTADAILLERIRELSDPNHFIVVSGDQQITQAAVRRRIRVLPPGDFAAQMVALSSPADDDPNPHLTPDEIAEWMRLFGEDPDES